MISDNCILNGNIDTKRFIYLGLGVINVTIFDPVHIILFIIIGKPIIHILIFYFTKMQ